MLTILGTLLALFTGFILVCVIAAAHYRNYIVWESENRHGLSYYGKSLAERRAFKREIKRRGALLLPFIKMEVKVQNKRHPVLSIEYQNVAGPRGTATRESFEAAHRYEPKAEDVFVVTQMKCGTTWMQQIVYEVLSHGDGDLTDSGHGHLYAVSPWIEAIDGVPVQEAPVIGKRGKNAKRLIKTHLPRGLCPYSEKAKYIYVARHPVSCFASTVDFYQLMAGPLAPLRAELLDWFLSDSMWWSPWPDHVAGWWDRSREAGNVLFVHFEEMKKDLEGVIRRVAQFLGETLNEEELEKGSARSNFHYMKANEECFEMSPPNLYSIFGTYFKSGEADRNHELSEEERRRILEFSAQRLAGRSYPVTQFYPDIKTLETKERRLP